MNALNLDAIEARANAATGGRWYADDGAYVGMVRVDLTDEARDLDQPAIIQLYSDAPGGILLPWSGDRRRYDADFIAHAREDVPALIVEVRRLQAENTNLRSILFDEPPLLDMAIDCKTFEIGRMAYEPGEFDEVC